MEAETNRHQTNVVISAVLFYLTKKRQWELRASIRRSARRLTAPLKSPGLLSPRFNRGPSSQTRSARPGAAPSKPREVKIAGRPQNEKQKQQRTRVEDIEKDEGTKLTATTPEGQSSGWKRFITFKGMGKTWVLQAISHRLVIKLSGISSDALIPYYLFAWLSVWECNMKLT